LFLQAKNALNHAFSRRIQDIGSCYGSADATNLYAFSPQGATNWIFHTGGGVRSSPAIGTDGAIYVGSMDGSFYSITPGGSTNWVLPLGDVIRASPALGADGTIYITSVSNSVDRLFALTPDGSRKWISVLGPGIGGQGGSGQSSSPSIGPDGTIYVPSSVSQKLYAIDETGSIKWSFPLGGPTYCSPAIGPDGTIYIGGDAGALYAVDPRGHKKWMFPTGLMESSPAVASNGTIYAASLTGWLYAIDPNGVQKWRFGGTGFSSSPAIASDGRIYIGDYAISTMFVLSQAGATIQTLYAPNNFSSPAIGADGNVYYGAANSLYVVYETNSLQASSWPMFRRDIKHTARSIQRGISAPFVLPDGSVGMTFTVEVGLTYRLLTSTDLVSWSSNWTSFVPTNSKVQFVDSTATNLGSRYYRLATP
jgi:outer membrane protein assembly factor BamB